MQGCGEEVNYIWVCVSLCDVVLQLRLHKGIVCGCNER